jgi:hypothetical protein
VSIGNWWHDYDYSDSENYTILGIARSVDRFPQLLVTRPIRLPLDPDYTMILLLIMVGIIGVTGVLGIRLLMKRHEQIVSANQ